MSQFWCETAWVGKEVVRGVLISCDDQGDITAVETTTPPSTAAIRLDGLTFPGFANTHSHAFHRALRGRSQRESGSFWSWREAMYKLANRLDPDNYLRLATAAFAEMALAGFTVVGEFHYLHHQPGGQQYQNPNVMGEALGEAARVAGMRLTLLDTCYLQGGINQELSPPQRRFADASVDAWAERRNSLPRNEMTRVGAAIHSIRAVPRDELTKIAELRLADPLHVHLSEQRAENEDCLAAYGLSPTALLAAEGVLSETVTAVHAINLGQSDIATLSSSGATVCACPTAEADLGDGIGPFADLRNQGVPLSLGTDQHVHIDPFLEMQRLELDQRLRAGLRSIFPVHDLIDAATKHGYQSLGWNTGGRIALGAPCDLTTINVDSVRMAGMATSEVAMFASAADVETVVVGGRVIVAQGEHALGDISALLREAIDPLWR